MSNEKELLVLRQLAKALARQLKLESELDAQRRAGEFVTWTSSELYYRDMHRKDVEKYLADWRAMTGWQP